MILFLSFLQFEVEARDFRTYFQRSVRTTMTVLVVRNVYPTFINLNNFEVVSELEPVEQPIFTVQAQDTDLLEGVSFTAASKLFSLDKA